MKQFSELEYKFWSEFNPFVYFHNDDMKIKPFKVQKCGHKFRIASTKICPYCRKSA